MDQHISQQAVIALYCGIDRHSNNHVVVVDEQDRRRVEKRLPNGLRARLR